MSDGWLQRIPFWFDWAAALGIAVVVFNVNVTSSGDPLNGPRTGLPAAGITEEARTMFYGSLAIIGAMFAAALLVVALVGPARHRSIVVGLRTFALVCGAGLAGLLLDHRDGPVRLLQLVVYLVTALGVLRLVRLSGIVMDVSRRADVVGPPVLVDAP